MFSLWDIAGCKDLVHDGERLTLTARAGLRLSLNLDLPDGAFYAASVPATANLRASWDMIERLSRLSGAKTYPTLPEFCIRPKHRAMQDMRSLQALDGFLCGALHRQIGESVFGGREPGGRWHADSGLRTQVRSLIRRGRNFMNGGYLRLVGLDPGGFQKT